MVDIETAGSLAENIQRAIDTAVQSMIQDTLARLVVDPDWLDKIQKQVDVTMAQRVTERLSTIDMGSLIAQHADGSIDRLRQRLRDDVALRGLVDQATVPQLTIMDEATVVENCLVSRDTDTHNNAKIGGTLTVNNLVVRGVVNTDNRSWHELSETIKNRAVAAMTQQWRDDLVKAVIDQARVSGIDFNTVTIQGQPLVSDGCLAADIHESSLQRVGVLHELEVQGQAGIANTLRVRSGRVGINTDSPEMALSVWDEETNIVAGKLSRDRAWIGTGRHQNLALGVDRDPAIEIDKDGLTTVKKLRVDRFRIGHATDLPGWSGSRGDFMFNSDPKPQAPFAWVCLGGFRWQPLGAIG